MNAVGILVGLVLLLVIGLGHVWVIRLEYYVGAHIWRLVLLLGILIAFGSIFSLSFNMSALLGIIAGSIIWGATELPAQQERVRRGIFPSNPMRSDRRSDDES